METDETRQSNGDDGCPPTEQTCDPASIDLVACRAEGIAKQAEYDAKYTPDLSAAKQKYDDARKQYRLARKDAAIPYKEMRHQAKHLVERIRCMIEQRRVWVCLDDAYCEVIHDLDCCQHPPGCCVRERDFDVSTAEQLGVHGLERLIKRYQRWTDEAKDCFTKLLGEPAALTQRVTDAKAKLAEIEKALSDDKSPIDLKLQYASAKVAQRNVEQIYQGFNRTQDYVDCLCLALTTWSNGCQAVSELTRIEAFKQCCDRQEQQRCTELETKTVDEILAVYDRLCGSDPCEDEGSDGKEAPDDDCGCHHRDHHHDDDDDDDGSGDDDDTHDDGDDEVCSKCGRRHRHHRHHHHHRYGCGCGESHDESDDDSNGSEDSDDDDSEDSDDSNDSDSDSDSDAGDGGKSGGSDKPNPRPGRAAR